MSAPASTSHELHTASHNNKPFFDYNFATVLKRHAFSDVSQYRRLVGVLRAMMLDPTSSSNRSVSAASYAYSSRHATRFCKGVTAELPITPSVWCQGNAMVRLHNVDDYHQHRI